MLSMQLSITFLREFDNETLNDELTDVSFVSRTENICPVVLEFWEFTEGFILREFDVNIKLHCTDIMFGVQRPHMKTYYIKKKYIYINVILIAKMCISIFIFYFFKSHFP